MPRGSRKRAYTTFLKTWAHNYCALPRKQKKAIKRRAERLFFYDRARKRVYVFSRLLLSKPIPSFFKNMFSHPPLPQKAHTVTFRRYTQSS